MADKTVACIIPCYGYAHFLFDCVESVVNQSTKANEIIIVNDGSKDNTSEITKRLIKKYPNDNIILIEKENGGLSSARNAGIMVSTSQYCFCLDADDILRPDAIKEHLALMDENTIGQCALMWFGNQTGTWYPQGATYESMRRTNSVFCNAMFPKKKWEGVMFDESETMRLGWEDYLFWFELIKKGCTVKTSNYVALLYRKHGKNMTETQTHPNIPKIKAYMKAKHSDLLF